MTRSRRRGWVAVVVAVALVGAGAAGWALVRGAMGEDAVLTHEVVTERFVRRVTAEGNLRAVEATPLIAPREARAPLKIAWLVEEGTRVEKGDLVARFDPTQKERELADGEAAHEASRHRIASERIQTGAALRSRDRAADMAAREREQTREFQAVDTLIFSRNQIVESEIDEGLATAKESHARAVKGVERKVSKSRLELLEIQRRAAEFKVAEAQRVLASMELRTPHAGVVVLRRSWTGIPHRVGDTVWSGQALAEIPLVSEMEAKVFVLEADASGLEKGKAATVIVESRPDLTFAGTIKQVDSLARRRHEEVPVQYFAVTIELERTDTEIMKPGQRVRAELVLDDRDAVVVPRQAVFERDGAPVVFVQRDGAFQPVAVELGPSTPGRVVVESGLSAGDRIALRDPSAGPSDGDDSDAGGPRSAALTRDRGR